MSEHTEHPSPGVATSTTAPGRELVIDVRDVTAGYLPGVDILTDTNLQAYDGELIGIIGPNGAGKSTLLKAIFGLVTVRSGTISLRGEEITNLKANKLVGKGVGLVPQTENVFPTLTIQENLEMGAYQRPTVVKENLAFVLDIFPALKDRLNQVAGSLSGGERQMVAMSRALMMRPDVLLLDEPSAGLSPVRQDDAFIRVSSINEAGVTTIMVEQNARRCLQICDRAYVLDQGKDAHTGTGRELLNDERVIGLYLGTLGQDASPS
ncbi:ABC transporter ATP-binding protein [uncultured Ornithinimicrobium sp.]|uniref:ABC transporter ATP-binding protein n=1 Tax=uncultured Ornithinimicrobium sp. TaxID=259307 RepID=UPI002591619E|nr:ABC transporter ATP-binding protein [uncultured Ornithinimicrobium sp.]